MISRCYVCLHLAAFAQIDGAGADSVQLGAGDDIVVGSSLPVKCLGRVQGTLKCQTGPTGTE